VVLIRCPFLVHGLGDASVRYRLGQFVDPLAERGIRLEIHEIPSSGLRRMALFREIRSAPVVGVQRKLFSIPYLYLLRRMVRRMIFDFDDALYVRDSRHDHRRSLTRQFRFSRTLRLADAALAGNAYLGDAARAHCRQVHVLPTTIDLDRYRPRRGRRNPKDLTVGWIGSRSTLFYLEDLAPALEAMGARMGRLRLKIIADDFIRLEKVEVIRKRWSEQEEVEDLREVDIGIMPLRDDAWARGKCGLKLLQYMAMGIPVVCSPVGTNLDLVTDGVEGLHARTSEEWVAAVETLAANPSRRRRMGIRGRRKVESLYSAAKTAPALASIIHAVHER
jgi:glycosyltransferase involved in cell wall biosynthesis